MMTNLIPMAGEGSRFKTCGYSIPKPLITVSNKPMVILASDFLPQAERWIYLCRREHLNDFKIDQKIKEYKSSSIIFSIDQLTEGQACTCLYAKNYINNDDELLIAASDNGMIWDQDRFNALKQECDCIIWTFRGYRHAADAPEAYGWIVTDEDKNALKVSVKVPISDHPFNDHAVVGAFWFAKGSIFIEAAERMIKKDRRVKNEFYVDEAINEVIEAGYKVKVFEIDRYICWGTPNDLKTFEYWQEFFDRAPFHPYAKKDDICYGK